MSLADEYTRQRAWRDWDTALASLRFAWGAPNARVLDLGCGTGDVTALLHSHGADVVGVDVDAALLSAARAAHPDIRFEQRDAATLEPSSFGSVDGIWSSFALAYFTDLDTTLRRWASLLRPGGWMALVEIDDLFGHRPVRTSTRALIDSFYAEALQRYDFRRGAKLAAAVTRAGLTLVDERTLRDEELSFTGPASADVLEAWRLRLQRMGGFSAFLGERRFAFEAEFLSALSSPSHESDARVMMVVARR